MWIKFLIFVLLFFSSCRSLKLIDPPSGSLRDNKTPNIKKVWIRETFSKNFTRPSILQSINPLLDASGLVIQGNKVNGISAYTLDKGKKRWFFPIEGGLAGAATISDAVLFFGGSDGVMYALRLDTGTVLWQYRTGLTSVSAPTIKGNYLYFASSNKIYCLDKKTGESIWTYSTPVRSAEFTVEGIARPLLSDSLIYFKVSDGTLVALDFKGRLKWKQELSGSDSRFTSALSNPVMGKICLYSASLESGIYCLNKKTGKIIWKTSKGSHGDLLLSGSSLLYPSHDGHVIALDQKSGKQIWKHKVPQSIATSLSLYKDILIYGEYSGALRFISINTGEELNAFHFGTGMSAKPVVSVIHSELYFISNAGWLYKLSLKNL